MRERDNEGVMRSTYVFGQETSVGQMGCHLIGSGRLLLDSAGHCRHSLVLFLVLLLSGFLNLIDGRPEPSLTFQVIAGRLVGFGQRVIDQLDGTNKKPFEMIS
jgi:hypothetical protein